MNMSVIYTLYSNEVAEVTGLVLCLQRVQDDVWTNATVDFCFCRIASEECEQNALVRGGGMPSRTE